MSLSANTEQGVLIAIEGIDGAGKTTQVRLLQEALQLAGELVVASKEPTNGKWGSIIRESAFSGRMSPQQELEAFINDRTEHVETLIGPALAQGSTVILDRYFYSSIAYQGSRGADVDGVRDVMESRFPTPDAVFILDIDPTLSVHRIAFSRGETPNHFEDRENLRLAREIFRAMNKPVIYHLDGTLSISALHNEIIRLLLDFAFKAKRCAKSYGCNDPYHCTFKHTDTCEWVRLKRALRPVGVAAG